MTVGAGIGVAEGNLVVLGKRVLRDVHENIVVTPASGGALVNGAFIGVRSNQTGCRRVFPIGKLEYVTCFSLIIYFENDSFGFCLSTSSYFFWGKKKLLIILSFFFFFNFVFILAPRRRLKFAILLFWDIVDFNKSVLCIILFLCVMHCVVKAQNLDYCLTCSDEFYGSTGDCALCAFFASRCGG
jgi:hypothetical protein